ncbi:alpha-2-macroglobulin [Ponticaulis sp.]|uniref:alpha-2-macroglobulin family protein n=1 Tax=Ponticaulis sp. TaxID=2020902 RepID=UPI000B753CE4|nr:alpha-2-macroglobulin [Ponticaulis sp.]MAI89951.1 alpha-2-macroglobulin [Ponticaulis sp.]OUX99619.1 MAG: alpha-2-macroglobulin [Hyphomonadaceae bacterium TMED5]|tara:strand:- start:62386 stop:67338 length:4953 start_codon:yes stop_codon:yes gene_type:complete
MRYWQGFIVALIAILVIVLIQNSLSGDQTSPQSETQSLLSSSGSEASSGSSGARDAQSLRRIEERDRLRQEASAANEQDFGFLRYRADTSGAAPLACLAFSAPLNPETDYSTYVEVSPATALSYSANGQDLCIGGLTFADSRELTLREGFPAQDGRVLEESETMTVDFTDRPPYVGFSGSGVILPRLDADGLPIETVNVDKVLIEVTRVNDRALAFKSVMEGYTRSQGGYGYLYGEENPRDVETEIWSGEMDIEAQQNAPVVSVFPLAEAIGEMEPGAYFVTITDARENLGREGPPAQARRWIIMTDLALSSYWGETGLDVVVRSLQTARQVGNVTLQLVAESNEVLAEATTDGTRAVHFDRALLNGSGNMRPRMLAAFGPQGDFAMLDLNRAPIDLSSEGIGGRTPNYPVDGFVYTERGIYRPGETIHAAAMLRDDAGRAVTGRHGRFIVYRPNGMEATRLAFTETQLGGVTFDYDLPRTASRGQWRVVVEVDGIGEVGSTRVSVEDFVPQRIRVDVEADTDTPLRRGDAREVDVSADFLYGAPGAGLVVQAEARLESDPSPFDDFEDYRFGIHDEVFRQEIIEFPEQMTDGAGRATLALDPESRGVGADMPLRLRTVVSVLEPGGRAVSDSVIIPYRPRTSYLGVRPDFEYSPSRNEAFSFDIASVSPEGEALAANVGWRLIQVYYTYDWYREGEAWRWRRSRVVREVNQGVLDIGAGETGEVSIDPLEEYGDYRMIVTDRDTNEETSYQFWVGWGGRASDGVEAPDRVRLSVSEDAPTEGERAELTLLPPYAGEAQIVVATDHVLSVSYMSVTEAGAEISLPVTAKWGEGAYVMVSVFSERDAITQPRPRRAVGVSYVPVNTESRTFDVSFDVPDLVRPRTEQTIGVTLENGPREPIFMTVAAVDEGILQLTRFQTPDPADWYFGKMALGVDIYDDYGRLLDPNMAAPGEIRSGGDQLGGEGLTVVPTRTVALWSGMVDVGRNGRGEVTFDVPDFNGELRLMAVAWSANGVGSGDQALTVRDEVPVELSLPRFLAPGDEAVGTASIDNVELVAGEFDALLRSSGPVSFADEGFSASLEEGQRFDQPVDLSAGEEGVSTLSIAVEGPENFSVERSYQIQTRSAFLPETRITRTLIGAGDAYSIPDEMLAGFVPGSEETIVSFSALPIDAAALYASLSRYPYACTEQITSRALPLLYSEQLATLAGTRDNGAQGRARQAVQEAVNSLLNRQSPDGSIGLWREGDRNASPWLGAYATDFLLRAREAGYVVPSEALERALGTLANVSQGEAWRVYGYDTDVWESRWHSDTEDRLMRRSAPFALYVLAKAGEADISRVRYMHDRELSHIESPLARAQLGAALAILGDRSRATSAFEAAVDVLGYENNGDYYQTSLRDLAGILSLAAEVNMTDVVEQMSERLGDDIRDANRLTTQEKAFLLLALEAMTQGEATPLIETDIDGSAGRYVIGTVEEASEASFTNTAEAPVWQTTYVRGAPVEAPPASSSDFTINKRLYSMQGRRPDLGSVQRGDRLVIALTLLPEQRRTNPMIVEDLLPAGFEIEAILQPSDGVSEDGAFSWIGDIAAPKIAEARDDRFVAAIDVREDAVQLAYVVRAVTPGEFTFPGAVTEDMYRPDVFARSQSQTVTIIGDEG